MYLSRTLTCYLTRLVDSYRDQGDAGRTKLVHRGFQGFERQLREVENGLLQGECLSVFGRETVEGVCKYSVSQEGRRTAVHTILFHEDECVTLRPVEDIAISSTGHVAVITNCNPPLRPLYSTGS